MCNKQECVCDTLIFSMEIHYVMIIYCLPWEQCFMESACELSNFTGKTSFGENDESRVGGDGEREG